MKIRINEKLTQCKNPRTKKNESEIKRLKKTKASACLAFFEHLN